MKGSIFKSFLQLLHMLDPLGEGVYNPDFMDKSFVDVFWKVHREGISLKNNTLYLSFAKPVAARNRRRKRNVRNEEIIGKKGEIPAIKLWAFWPIFGNLVHA